MSRLSSMGEMAATVAHELNQPLTAISNYMEAANALLQRGGELPLSRIATVLERAGEKAVRAGQITAGTTAGYVNSRTDKTGFRKTTPFRIMAPLESPFARERAMLSQQYEAEIAAFIRQKGITRCPTACVAPTHASGSAADRVALRQRAERHEAQRQERARRAFSYAPAAQLT